MTSNLNFQEITEQFTSDANNCVEFQFIRNTSQLQQNTTENQTLLPGQHNENRIKSDLAHSQNSSNIGLFKKISPTTIFNPDMSHQIYGESESIFGYKNLKISFTFSAVSLTQYFSISYDEKLSVEEHGCVPQNIEEKLIEHKLFLENCIKGQGNDPQQEKFSSIIENDDENINLDKICSKKMEFQNSKNNRTFEIRKGNIKTHENLRSYHQRLQFFLLWFVDGASYIEDDDDKWDYYFLFERYFCEEKQCERRQIAGYATVYNWCGELFLLIKKIIQLELYLLKFCLLNCF